MNAIERALLFSVPVALLIVEVVALATGAPVAPHHLLDAAQPIPFFAVVAVAIAFFALERKDVLPLLVLGVTFELVQAIVRSALFGTPFVDALLLAGSGLWYASLCLSAWQALRSEGSARLRALDGAAIKFALPASIPLTLFTLWATSQVLPHTYDSFLYAFDGLLLLPLADMAGRTFATYPTISQVFNVVYQSFMLVACLFMVSWGNGRLSGSLISRWIVAALFGSALYFVMPAVGPAVAFDATYSKALPDPAAVPLALFPASPTGYRNAMPSLHTTWAFLIAIIAWRSGPVPRIIASMNFAATVIATLGLREHYLIDLIVAVPFTVAVHGLVSWYDVGGRRSHAAVAAIGGAMLSATCLLTIRFGIDPLRASPWMASVLVLGTMIASGWLLCRLERGTEPGVTKFALTWERAMRRTARPAD